ncbi:MAG: Glycerol-3-phosphate dehydrogenase [Anaerolineae bacterium]|nr:MAG: Glycerol-3-phosphate dehydrogenase [Anaerolineae bacterium]
MSIPSSPQILVIGAGSTGSAVAYDFALRGLSVTLVERGGVASGTTGHNQAQLHSGARYAVVDPQAARECIRENAILKNICPNCFELNGGFFVELLETDKSYRDKFLQACQECHIPLTPIGRENALQREPNLNPDMVMAYYVPEGTFDPYRLCLSFLTSAASLGAQIFTFSEVTEISSDLTITIHHRPSNQKIKKKFDAVVNATGPWVNKTAKLAGITVPVEPSAGVMITLEGRVCNHVINLLAPPGDGDIIVPQRNSCILGTTSWTVDDPDDIKIPCDHIEKLFLVAEKLIPSIRNFPVRGMMASARPLIKTNEGGRSTTRGFTCQHHIEQGIPGLFSVLGGKTTTARLMAEKTCDDVCNYLNWDVPCKTAEKRLLSYREWHRFNHYL